MCFKLRKQDIGKEPKVATKNIVVYKVINTVTGYGWSYNMRDKNGKIMLWAQGYIYYEESKKLFRKDKYGRVGDIGGGCIHSKKTNIAAQKIGCYGDERVVKMIIPKGALYYENDTEYVSNILYYPVQKIKK